MAAWNALCRGEGCNHQVGLHGARGLCPTHYSRWRKYGDPDTVYEARSPLERLWVRTERQGDCLVFTGAISSTGYGSVTGAPEDEYKRLSPHVVVCEAFYGPPLGQAPRRTQAAGRGSVMTVEQYAATNNGSALATVPDTAPAVHTTQVADLVKWAEQAQAAYKLSEMICNSEFTPQQYRGKPEKAAAAMLAGAELGFSPMTALNAYDVIQGAASLKARTMLAIVQSKGHYVKFLEKSPTRVVVEGHRQGQPETLQTAEWTIQRAEVAGYVKKNPNYASKPQEMLVARATSEICRAIASDALLGIAFTTEELQDDPSLREVHPDERRAALPSPRQARRGSTTVSPADLTGDAVVDVSSQPEAPPEQITKDQAKRIGDAFKAAGVSDRAARARIVDSLTDRPISGPGDLSHDEAASLIAELEDMGSEDIAALADVPQQTQVEWPEVQAPAGDDQ